MILKRAEQYVHEYRARMRQQLRLQREARACGNIYVPDQPRLAFVVRIRGINQMHPRPRKASRLSLSRGWAIPFYRPARSYPLRMVTFTVEKAKLFFILRNLS